MKSVIKSLDQSSYRVPIVVLWIVITGCYILTMLLNNAVATYGEQIATFDRASRDLEIQNMILGNRIANNSSFVHIESTARGLGFKPVQNVVYIYEKRDNYQNVHTGR